MSKKLFTNEEIEILSKNKYIKNITTNRRKTTNSI